MRGETFRAGVEPLNPLQIPVRPTVLHRRNVGFKLFPHSPYSPDLAPSDFYLFPKLKEFTKGRQLADDEDVICTANSWLEDQDQQLFYNGIRAVEKRRTNCISVEGDYVEQ